MNVDFFLAITPILGLLIQMSIHFILSRIFPGRNPWSFLFIGFFIGLIAMIVFITSISILYKYATVNQLAVLMVDTGAMISLGFCYFNFVNLNYTSLRIRLLREFLLQNGKLTLPNIFEKYNAEKILAARLSRLIAAGELLYDGQYYLPGMKSRFSILGSVLAWFKRILLIR